MCREIPITSEVLPDLSNVMVSKRYSCDPGILSELHWNGRYGNVRFQSQRLGLNGNYPREQGHRGIHCSGCLPSVLMIRLRIDLSEGPGILNAPGPFDT